MPEYQSSLRKTKKVKKNNESNESKAKKHIFIGILSAVFPWKGDKGGDVARKLVMLVSVFVLCFATYMIIDYYYFRDIQIQDQWQQGIVDLVNKEPTSSEVEQLPNKDIIPKYATFYGINPDIIGWIKIDNTKINYPVVQSGDNSYYLDHDFYKRDNPYGAVFADYEGRFTQTEVPNNAILYGHNLDNSNGFTHVMHFKNIDELKKTPIVEFDTLYEMNKYKVFSIMMVNTKETHGEVFNYHTKLYFGNKQEFNDYVSECLDRTMIYTGVDLKYGDELITLSTCDLSSGLEDLRCVLVARKLRDGESSEVDTSKFVYNENPKYFKAYYDANPGTEWLGRNWNKEWVEGLE